MPQPAVDEKAYFPDFQQGIMSATQCVVPECIRLNIGLQDSKWDYLFAELPAGYMSKSSISSYSY